MRTVEQIKTLYADIPPRTRAWLQSIGSTSLSDCLALLDHIEALEAQNAALQGELNVAGGWVHPHAELPPMTDGYRSEIVVVATEAQYHYKENRWILNSEPFGWKAQLPDPDESPTATESEE